MNLYQNLDFYKQSYQISLENSKGLSKIAENAANEKEYGIASSLKILSAEEAIKAAALIMLNYNKNSSISSLEKLFRDHKTKHEMLEEIPLIINALVEIRNTDFAVLNYLFETLDKLP